MSISRHTVAEQLRRLLRFFRPDKSDAQLDQMGENLFDAYYSALRYLAAEELVDGVDRVINDRKDYPYLPRPAELRGACYKTRSKDADTGQTEPGCSRCRNGFVSYLKSNPDYMQGEPLGYTNPCAYCFPEHVLPQAVIVEGLVYFACQSAKIPGAFGESEWGYKADLHNLAPVEGSRLYPPEGIKAEPVDIEALAASKAMEEVPF